MTALQPVEGGFRGQVQALIGEARHELLGRQVRELRTFHEAQDLGLFGERQGIAGAVAWSAPTIVARGVLAPAFDGASRDPGDPAGLL